MKVIELGELHSCLGDPVLASVNFLNGITTRYPQAVSFAPGAPYASYLADVDVPGSIQRYLDHRGASAAELLLPYGPTAGQINDLVAAALAAEEGIQARPESVVVTVGCQEALFLTVRTLMADREDVLLAVDPCYVGLSGAASVLGIDVVGVAEREHGLDPDDIVAACVAVRDSGRRPRALYVIPDFANPTGQRLDLNTRRRLLDVAAEEDLLLIEDNPYGFTAAEDSRIPVLKSLDTQGRVVYLGTFSKVCGPGVRIGFAVADQRVSAPDGSVRLLADALTAVKSMITLNTSPITQAVVGGMLLDGHGLRSERKAAHYRANLTALVSALEAGLPAKVSWHAPAGGFFTVLDLPFDVGHDTLETCARDYGVLFTPMRDFYVGAGGDRQIRLACSNLNPPLIRQGADRLCRFIRDAM